MTQSPTIDGAPTGLKCRATNSGWPDYLLCGRELYRYTTPTGQIDQCGAGHFSEATTVPEVHEARDDYL